MLNGRVAVITGASSGIGAALARLLAREGASVVIAARRKDKLDRVATDISASLLGHSNPVLAVECDVTERKQADDLIARSISVYGRLDILVNNAGRGHLASVEETTDEVLESMFRVNAFALWYTTQPALVQMKRQGSGHIINIASMAGKLGYPFNSAYVAAKHACVGFTAALRMELAETGIHASVVCPGGVLTDWATSTEGGPMLPLFSASGPIVKKIARERGITPPPIEGVIPPERVAEDILACIYQPVPEVYTHKGSEEFLLLAAQDRVAAERQQLPVVLGEREAYAKLVEGNKE